MASLQTRLGAGLTLSLIVVFALQWVVVSVALRELSESSMVVQMEHDVDNLLTGLSFDAAGRPQLAEGRVEQVYLHPFSGHYFRIATGEQVLRSRSLWDQDLATVRLATGTGHTHRVVGPLAQPLLMLTRAFELHGHTVTISVAVDLTPLETDLRRFRDRYAIVSGAALLALLLLQSLLVRLSLRPFARTRAALAQLERGEIGRLDENVLHELRPLVRELNRLLTTMQQRLARSRQALGNLAHAMKTPLTLLGDLSHRIGDGPAAETRAELAAVTRTLGQLVERELARARLAGTANPGQRFDFDAELPPLLDTLRSIHQSKALTLEARVPPQLRFAADREDLLELLGNLLDNACKWARTKVVLTATVVAGKTGSDSALVLDVEDDGPGCPPEDLPRLTQRGLRLDENTAGHGLGLAIVQDIVASLGGTVEFGRSAALGGFLAGVHLPLNHAALNSADSATR
jgi:signal transduction histidine kinase